MSLRHSAIITLVAAIPTAGIAQQQQQAEQAKIRVLRPAQIIQKADGGNVPNEINDAITSAVSDELVRISRAELLLEVNEMQKMFKFKDAAAKKLQLAARGAASRAVDAAKERNQATITRLVARRFNGAKVEEILMNGRRVKLTPDSKDDEEGEGNDDDDDTQTRLPAIMVGRRGASFYLTVKHENGSSSTSLSPRDPELRSIPVWKNTVEKVLNAEQKKAYADYKQQKIHDLAVVLVTTVVDYELKLTDKQKPKFRSIVSENIKVSASNLVSGPDYILQYIRPQLDPKLFKDVLSKTQMELLESRQAYYRRFMR